MSLHCDISDIVADDAFFTQDELPLTADTWAVVDTDGNGAMLWGFARKQDAEIARQFLLTLNVDWDEPDSRILWSQLAECGYPTRRSLMTAACQRLQW